jgi:hypothetical protein
VHLYVLVPRGHEVVGGLGDGEHAPRHEAVVVRRSFRSIKAWTDIGDEVLEGCGVAEACLRKDGWEARESGREGRGGWESVGAATIDGELLLDSQAGIAGGERGGFWA